MSLTLDSAIKKELFVSSPASTPETNTTNNISPDSFSNVNIEQSLKRFELALSSLVDSLAKFAPDVKCANEVLASDRALNDSIVQLKEHFEAGLTIRRLSQVSDNLDKQLSQMLLNLTDGRQKLKAISSGVATIPDRANEKPISAEKLINYATRITKFTHAPPGYSPGLPNEHANYPWPSEDELRRGVLALSALHGSLDKERYEGSGQVPDKVVPDQTSSENASQYQFRNRANSLVSYDDRPISGTSSGAAGPQALELDLFDPDDDDEEEEP